MFKKLKGKFILINMFLLTTVFISIFGTIYMMTVLSYNRDINMKLKSIMFSPQRPIMLKANMDMSIVIEVDNNNVIKVASVFNVDDWNIKEVVKEISDNESNLSKIDINGNSYSFYKQNLHGVKRIVLISREFQKSMLSNLLKVLIVVGLLSLIILFIISIYFTSKAIKPLEETFIKQKQFIADASHELRTPITIIKTNLEILKSNKNKSVDSQSKWIDYISTQTDRMSVLISEMLALANLDTNKNSKEFIRLNISEVLKNSLLVFEVIIFEKGLTLEEKIQEDIYINGDEDQIKKLISIFMDNAIKYTDINGKIEVTIKKEKNKATLVVKNTGKGIESEYLDKIFERFYRLDTSRNRDTGGYGLGLSIAKSIVNEHRGKIYAKSNIGKDISFIVEIPLNNISI